MAYIIPDDLGFNYDAMLPDCISPMDHNYGKPIMRCMYNSKKFMDILFKEEDENYILFLTTQEVTNIFKARVKDIKIVYAYDYPFTSTEDLKTFLISLKKDLGEQFFNKFCKGNKIFTVKNPYKHDFICNIK